MSDTGLLDTGALDTGDLDAAPAGDGSSRAAITPRDAWRRARLPVAIGALLVLVAVLQTIAAGGRFGDSYLDPAATGQHGAGALAELLRDRGVTVTEVERPTGAHDVTVLVPIPEMVEPDVLAAATAAADLVVVEPPDAYAAATGSGVRLREHDDNTGVTEPSCAHPDAVAAGDARVRGVRFRGPETAVVCYAGSFLEVTNGGQRATFLGNGEFMTNERLDENGNAALALRLLTRHPTVEWVYPRVLASDEAPSSIEDLMPGRIGVFVWQLVVVALLLVAWRARRLGPVVVEPLPVVVRASEAVEGRARLYQAARSRESAAGALRAGLRDRLVRVLGLAPDASRETLVAAVSARTRRDGVAVDSLLYGPPPDDDPALVRLADELDSLYSEVRAQ